MTVSHLYMHPRHLSIKNFTYSLPHDRIAKFPLAERDASRLLIFKEGNISEDVYRNIADNIPENSFLVFNNSKVIEARILFQKPTGGMIEIFCLEPDSQYPDISSAMLQQEKVYWQCLVGGASKWKPGQALKKITDTGQGAIQLSASYIEKKAGSFLIELSWQPSHLSFAEVLHHTGSVPLPPYIRRDAEELDSERYQTIYALHDGSVAAPTAGLHFTERVFQQLSKKNISPGFITLHVSAGTFKPVKSETMETHEMHAEFIDVNRETIEKIISKLGNIIAVGTTSLRTLESLYWLGARNLQGKMSPNLAIGQWEPYEQKEMTISPKQALESLVEWMEQNKTNRLLAKTQLIIAPGYKTKIAKALVTNFHQPASTLLLLVAALVGPDWKKIYDYALQHDFRFLSYGDGCFLWISP